MDFSDELDEGQGLYELRGLGRGLIGRDIWAAVDNGRDLGTQVSSARRGKSKGSLDVYLPCRWG